MSGHTRAHVKLEAFAKVIQRQVDARGGPGPIYLGKDAVKAGLADQIAASGLMSLDAAKRRIYSILNPEYECRGKHLVQQVVDFDTADKILCALDLAYLWHTELADDVVFPRCSVCGGAAGIKNPGCKRCSDRFSLRRKRAKSGPALPPVAVESGLTSSRGATPLHKPRRPLPVGTSADASDERTVAA